jgi:hypothetical protein
LGAAGRLTDVRLFSAAVDAHEELVSAKEAMEKVVQVESSPFVRDAGRLAAKTMRQRSQETIARLRRAEAAYHAYLEALADAEVPELSDSAASGLAEAVSETEVYLAQLQTWLDGAESVLEEARGDLLDSLLDSDSQHFRERFDRPQPNPSTKRPRIHNPGFQGEVDDAVQRALQYDGDIEQLREMMRDVVPHDITSLVKKRMHHLRQIGRSSREASVEEGEEVQEQSGLTVAALRAQARVLRDACKRCETADMQCVEAKELHARLLEVQVAACVNDVEAVGAFCAALKVY